VVLLIVGLINTAVAIVVFVLPGNGVREWLRNR
jgi:hypothetical protein